MKAPSKTQPKAHPDHRSISEADAAEITARILLETESVLFRPDDPFTFTSGRKSPVYIDCRDAEWQDAVAQRLLDVPDPLAQRGEAGRTRHACGNIEPPHMRKAHLLTCNYR